MSADDVRENEDGNPIVAITKQIKLICHNAETVDEDGGELQLKLRVRKDFLLEFNRACYEMLRYAMWHSGRKGRSTLIKEDVLCIDEVIEDLYRRAEQEDEEEVDDE